MRQFIFELLKSVGTAAVVAGAAAWLTKSVITHFLSRKIEAYKVELKRESDKEIEEVKSRLQIVALERQIVFSRLHEKRAEIVAETYTLIHEVHSKAIGLIAEVFHAGLRTPKQRAQQVFDDCLKFYDFFQRRRIYFSEEVCTMMDKFVELIGETNAAVRRAPDNLDHSTKDGKEAYMKMAVLMDRLPEIKKLIEKDFRMLLGVIAPDDSASNKALQLTAR
jgi:hypothetical protein